MLSVTYRNLRQFESCLTQNKDCGSKIHKGPREDVTKLKLSLKKNTNEASVTQKVTSSVEQILQFVLRHADICTMLRGT